MRQEQEPSVRWMEESASVMLTIPPASDKIQQPLSCRLRCCTFWYYRKHSENVVLIIPWCKQVWGQRGYKQCKYFLVTSPCPSSQSQQMQSWKVYPFISMFSLLSMATIYKCCNLRWALWCSHIVLAIEHGCSIGNAHGKKCQRWKEN